MSEQEPSKIPIMFDTWDQAYTFLQSGSLQFKDWTIREIIVPKVTVKVKSGGLEGGGKLLLNGEDLRKHLQQPAAEDRIILATPGKYPEHLNKVETFKLLHEHISCMLYNALPITDAAELKQVTTMAIRYRIQQGLLDVIYKYDKKTGKPIACVLINDKFRKYQKGRHV